MIRLNVLLFTFSLLLIAVATLAGDDGSSKLSIGEIKRNYALLQAALDTDISLYTLERLNRNEQPDLVLFHEYRLDRVVCETSQFEGDWNPWQRKQMLDRYHQIKDYWRNNPRIKSSSVNIQGISTFLPEYDPKTATCTDKVLLDI